MTPAKFRTLVWRYYRAHGRHELPWRPPALSLRRDKTLDVYHVLISEVMLQQTQVNRVLPIYAEFTRRFPTARKLAAAPLSEVLRSWQGLGYNRRAKMLHAAAKALSEISRSNLKNLASRFDLDISELEKLPGVGPYTARAVAAFAYNQDSIVIETNIRTAIIHHF
ncbi:MAG: HhH-GPD family protein, partial [Minisyncoccota bacterium]